MNTKYLKLQEDILSNDTKISVDTIIQCINATNLYINELVELFGSLNFDLFEVLGQRNLSGVIGEIFSRFFCQHYKNFVVNPHPDGRPDILNLNKKEALKHYQNNCFINMSGKLIPKKSELAPFKFSGIEVKCTVGSPTATYKKDLLADTGKRNFELGMSRIKYLSGFNFWAHHRHSTNMICLYYDYFQSAKYRPQILGLFYVNLDKEDWHVVSLGSDSGKKTSNTSLNTKGLNKLYNGLITIVNNQDYIEKFKQLGIAF